MKGVITEPRHAHGFDRFERIATGWRAWCLCGACWGAPTKPQANQLLGKHLRERAREFRKVRNEIRRQGLRSGY